MESGDDKSGHSIYLGMLHHVNAVFGFCEHTREFAHVILAPEINKFYDINR